MKKFLFLLLAFVLAACGAGAPTEPPVIEPTATPQVILQTVVVTVIPTEVPTEVPTNTPLPPPPAAPTDTPPPAPTQEVAPPAAPAGQAMVDDSLGGGVFKNITLSGNAFSLRCAPKEITFSVTPTDANISSVDFYYRIEDKQTAFITEWKNYGKMIPDGSGNFVLNFSGESLHPDLRRAKAWFDFQFIGVSRAGGVVGRSEKIVQQVSYTIDCQ